MTARHPCLFIALLASALWAAPVRAEVRFGNNVFIGGHDASNQTFTSQRRGEYYLYDGRPPHQGCAWRNNRDGSRTKVCRLQSKPH